MATKVGAFFLEMVVDAASGNLSVQQLVGSLGDLDVASVTSVSLVGKIADGLWGLAKSATNASVELTALHDITGADPKMVQQWEMAAERIVHHTGSIIKALSTVHEMNKAIASGQGVPSALGTLGVSPYKIVDGKAQFKDAFEYMKEFAAKGSVYQTRSPDVQQKMLDQIFGGAGPDAFRTIKEMAAGRFHPERISVLNDGQVGALNKVDADWINVKQDVIGIFDKFLLAGNDIDKILSGARSLLEDVNSWLDKNKDHSYVQDLKDIKAAWKPSTLVDILDMPRNMMAARADKMLQPHVRVPASGAGSGEMHGKLDINLNANGKPVGSKQTYVGTGIRNADTWNLTDMLNLGGQGQ